MLKSSLNQLKQRKFLRRIAAILLSIFVFSSVSYQPVTYAQLGQNESATIVSVDQASSLIQFSIGLLVITVLIVIILLANILRVSFSKGANADSQARFENTRLNFAAVVLTGLGLIFLESMAMYYFAPSDNNAAKEIFDACKTVIPSIATLVIGYYFGKSEQNQRNDRDS